MGKLLPEVLTLRSSGVSCLQGTGKLVIKLIAAAGCLVELRADLNDALLCVITQRLHPPRVHTLGDKLLVAKSSEPVGPKRNLA